MTVMCTYITFDLNSILYFFTYLNYKLFSIIRIKDPGLSKIGFLNRDHCKVLREINNMCMGDGCDA